MRILAVCRGTPGLGRVTPSYALIQTLAASRWVTARFATYAAGVRYLTALGEHVTDLGQPAGLFIDAVSTQAAKIIDLAAGLRPDLVLVELARMYADHDVLVARAGRNTVAEAMYCGIPSVLLPVTADPHRGGEQAANARSVKNAPWLFPLESWQQPTSLRQTVRAAIAYAGQNRRRRGTRGNEHAAAFVDAVPARSRASANQPDSTQLPYRQEYQP